MIPMMILIVVMIVILIRIVDKRTCESCWSHIGDELPDVELNRYS